MVNSVNILNLRSEKSEKNKHTFKRPCDNDWLNKSRMRGAEHEKYNIINCLRK